MDKIINRSERKREDMGFINASLLKLYKNRVNKYKEQKPGELMGVVLQENVPVASKKQWCAKIPAYTDAEEDYSARNPKDFQRLEEIALLFPAPSMSKNENKPAVNPDIQRELREAGATFYFEVPGYEGDNIDDLEVMNLGPEHADLKRIQKQSENIVEATRWFVGRAVNRGDPLPYASDQGGKFFALKAFLFGHIAPYYNPGTDAELEIDRPIGKQEDKYQIKGELKITESQLKSPDDFEERPDIKSETDVEDCLEDHVEVLLTTIWRLGLFSEESVDESLHPNQIEVGAGDFIPPRITLNPDIEDTDLSPDELRKAKKRNDGSSMSKVAMRLDPEANASDTGVDFNLTYLL